MQTALKAKPYFDSAAAPGAKRAIENLLESAWYTRQQASAMANVYWAVVSLILVLSVLALVGVARNVGTVALREDIIRIVTAWLLLIVSLSMLKNAWAYHKMSQRCLRTELTCTHLLSANVTESDALKQWSEYHVSRAASPLIPQWLWRYMEESLDALWKAGRK